MIWGNLSLSLALLCAFFSALFFLTASKKNPQAAFWGKTTYYGFLLFTSFATIYLFILFLTHRFEFSYVYGYSSTDLGFFYLISSFWAGQEGTFLLWLFLGAILGIFLLKKERGKNNLLIFFFLLVQIFILILLLKKSPFELLPVVPEEGRGLNPLLLDFWMVIHPPLIFVGYAVLAIPFCFAVSALVRNKYDGWLNQAAPWVSFGSFFLGAGIFVGGYWAYKVLGWGGYWGWDPVENASLVPWLFSIVLLHGLLIEKRDRSLSKTNLFLATFTFLLVLYGTFLTRSGVLADFSVHSFTDLGINLFLVLGMIFFTILSLGLFLFRSSSIKPPPSNLNLLSQSLGALLGLIFILASAVLILLGTSSPILTGLLGKASKVNTLYYVRTNFPIAIILGIILGVTPVLFWRKSNTFQILKKLYLPVILSIILTLVAIFLQVRSLLYSVFLFLFFLVFFTNLKALIQRIKTKSKSWGAYLSHLGFGIMLVGILFSSAYNVKETVNLPLDEKKEALGNELTYKGPQSSFMDEDNFLKVEVQKNNRKFTAKPKFYYSDYTESIVRSPHIQYGLLSDLYLAPAEIEDNWESFTLVKGDSARINDYWIKFLSFDMSSHMQDEDISVGAVLEIEKEGVKDTLIPLIILKGEEKEQVEKRLSETELLYLDEVDADKKMVGLSLVDETQKEVLVLEVSKKPLISLVWLGTILIMVGLLVTTIRR